MKKQNDVFNAHFDRNYKKRKIANQKTPLNISSLELIYIYEWGELLK